MYCRKCGNKLIENAKFCGVCGTSVQVPEKNKVKTIEVKEEIIELPEEKLESLASDKTSIAMVVLTIVIALVLIMGISMI